MSQKSNKLLIARHHLEPAGVYDPFGRELTHAHVMAHYQDVLGVPLMKLAAHAARHADQPDHAIHNDLAEAANGRMTGKWGIDKFDAPIEYYAAQYLGCKEADVDWETLPADVKARADAALKKNHKATHDEWHDENFFNLFVTVGITALWQIAEGNGSSANSGGVAAGTYAAFNNAQARICVGDSSTAASASQTWLLATTNKYCMAMDSTYPTQSTNQTIFRATFASGNANFSWQEFVVDDCNGSNATATTQSGGSALDRVVSNQGTKAAGQTWQPSLTLSIS